MSNIKAIFIDIDRTLVYRIDDIPYIAPGTIESIQKARRHGISVILATGRSLPMAIPVAKQIGVYDDYMITSGGGTIIKNGEIIEDINLSNESTQIISAFLQEHNIYGQYYQGDKYYIEKETKHSEKYAYLTKFCPTVIGKDVYAMKDIKRVVVVPENDEMKEMILSAFSNVDGIITDVFWDYWIELLSPQTTKGVAVKKVCDIMNVDLKDVMAIGDDMNDVSMWDIVGYPVVCANAKDIYKTSERLLTESCENGGVGKAIEKYIFNNSSE